MGGTNDASPSGSGARLGPARVVRRWVRSVPYSARYLVNAYPSLYMPLARVRHADRADWAVGPQTELVIEGFGRSGSTFAVDAFELVQPRPVRLAHHTHAAAQVIRSVRLGVPVVLIVRRPAEAVVSHMARRGIPAWPALAAWVRYHGRILPYRDRLVAVPFEMVTSDMGAVIRAVNERFGTGFAEFEHSPENERRVFDSIEARNASRFRDDPAGAARSLARPTAERDALKAAYRADYEAPSLARLRARAESLYRALVGSAPEARG